ncbi:hypothetical protein, partial [Escherichia coli]|uniref:hypothetical protein n=1 Tax=Escherichia coli TaxID=562 RepID=UPI00201D1F53
MMHPLDKLKEMATLDNFARFLNESSANEKCLSCGDTDMYMYLTNIVEVGSEPKTAEECNLGTLVMLDYIGPFPGYPGSEVPDRDHIHNYEFRLTCTRCGYVHRYSARALMSWVVRQAAAQRRGTVL